MPEYLSFRMNNNKKYTLLSSYSISPLRDESTNTRITLVGKSQTKQKPKIAPVWSLQMPTKKRQKRHPLRTRIGDRFPKGSLADMRIAYGHIEDDRIMRKRLEEEGNEISPSRKCWILNIVHAHQAESLSSPLE